MSALTVLTLLTLAAIPLVEIVGSFTPRELVSLVCVSALASVRTFGPLKSVGWVLGPNEVHQFVAVTVHNIAHKASQLGRVWTCCPHLLHPYSTNWVFVTVRDIPLKAS